MSPQDRFEDLLVQARDAGATHIHIEPVEGGMGRARLRTPDMPLQTIQIWPRDTFDALIQYLAKRSGLGFGLPDESILPIESPQPAVLSLSSIRTIYGDKIVVRFMAEPSSDASTPTLDTMDLDQEDRTRLEAWLMAGRGLLIIGGQTHSFRNTLAQALMLSPLVEKRRRATLELNPRRRLDGVSQHVLTGTSLEVLDRNELGDHSGLATSLALRNELPSVPTEGVETWLSEHTPDLLYFREIGDPATAKICAAHSKRAQIITTLVAGRSMDLLERMRQSWGLEERDVGSPLMLRTQARLRRLCPHCKKARTMNERALKNMGFRPNELSDAKVFEAAGCDACTQGYRGHILVSEAFPTDRATLSRAWKAPNMTRFYRDTMRRKGESLRRRALKRMSQGDTSVTEVLMQTSAEWR